MYLLKLKKKDFHLTTFKNIKTLFSPNEAPIHYCYCDLFSKIKHLSQNCVTFQLQPEENTAIWAKTSGNAVLSHQRTKPKWQLACCLTHLLLERKHEGLLITKEKQLLSSLLLSLVMSEFTGKWWMKQLLDGQSLKRHKKNAANVHWSCKKQMNTINDWIKNSELILADTLYISE